MTMPDDLHSKDDTIQIRCPQCGQRFRVGYDLRGRMVECGSCEHRFRISDDVILQHRKFYPGEYRDPRLDAFQRVPMGTGLRSTGYSRSSGSSGGRIEHDAAKETAVDPQVHTELIEKFGPVPFYRVVFGIVGAVVMALSGLLMCLGAHSGGMLDGVTTDKRYILAGFLSILSSGLLLYGNPRTRLRAALAVVVGSAFIMSCPHFFQDASAPLQELGKNPVVIVPPKPAQLATASLDKLREQIGDQPLEEEIRRAEQSAPGSGQHVAGLWLRGLEEQYKLEVLDYIIRVTGANFTSHLYPRGGGDFLMVVSGLHGDINDLRDSVRRFGRVERVIDAIQVIEVVVDNQSFVEGPMDKLTNPNDPAFYILNKRELDSVDLRRSVKAAKRLADVEPKMFRADISKQLTQLLKEVIWKSWETWHMPWKFGRNRGTWWDR